MINLLVLTAWIGFGVVVALTDREEHHRQSIPMAVFLGPLWLAVTLERRSLAVERSDTEVGDQVSRVAKRSPTVRLFSSG